MYPKKYYKVQRKCQRKKKLKKNQNCIIKKIVLKNFSFFLSEIFKKVRRVLSILIYEFFFGILIITVFTSEYCVKPYSPSSRPAPDILYPPNGAIQSKLSNELTHTV